MVDIKLQLVFILFSNYLYSGPLASGAVPVAISGLAYISGVCNLNLRVSISHENGQYSVIESGAHELGHK